MNAAEKAALNRWAAEWAAKHGGCNDDGTYWLVPSVVDEIFLSGHRAAHATFASRVKAAIEAANETMVWLQWYRFAEGIEIGPLCHECEQSDKQGHKTDCATGGTARKLAALCDTTEAAGG